MFSHSSRNRNAFSIVSVRFAAADGAKACHTDNSASDRSIGGLTCTTIDPDALGCGTICARIAVPSRSGASGADGHVPGEQQLAGLAVDFHLDGGGVELVERRVAAERVLALAAQPAG